MKWFVLFLTLVGVTLRAANPPYTALQWTNVGGVIQPSAKHTTNMLQFTSGQISAGTNVSILIGSSQVWTNGDFLASFQNAGISQSYIGPNGAYVNRYGTNWWGTDLTGAGILLNNETSLGDYWFNEIVNRVAHDDNHFGMFEADIETNRVFFHATVTTNGATKASGMELLSSPDNDTTWTLYHNNDTMTFFWPSMPTSTGDAAYTFNTSHVMTNADDLISIKNNGTERAAISFDGALSAGNTNRMKTGAFASGLTLTANLTNSIQININGTNYNFIIANQAP